MVVGLAGGQGTDRALACHWMLVNDSLKFLKSIQVPLSKLEIQIQAFQPQLWGLGWIKKTRGRKKLFHLLFSCCNFNQDQILENRSYWDKFSWTSTDVTAQGEVAGQGTATSTPVAHTGTGLHSSSQDHSLGASPNSICTWREHLWTAMRTWTSKTKVPATVQKTRRSWMGKSN